MKYASLEAPHRKKDYSKHEKFISSNMYNKRGPLDPVADSTTKSLVNYDEPAFIHQNLRKASNNTTCAIKSELKQPKSKMTG